MNTVTVKNTFVDVLDCCDDFDVGPSNFSRGITEPSLNKLRQCLGIYAPPSEKAALVDVVAGESQDNLPMLSAEDASEATGDHWARLGTPGDYLSRLVTHDPMHDNFDHNFDSLVEEEELSDPAHVQLISDYGRNGIPPGLSEMTSPPLVREKELPSYEEAFSRLATPSDPFTRLQTPGGEFTRLVTQDPLSDMDFRSYTRVSFGHGQHTTQLSCAAEEKAVPSTRSGLSPQGGPKNFGAGTEVKLAPAPAQSRSITEDSAAPAPAKSPMGQNPVMQMPMMYQPQMMMMPWPGPMFHMQQQQSVQQQQEDDYASDKNKRQRKKKPKPAQPAAQFRGRPSLIDMAMNQKQHIQMMVEEQNRDDPVVGRCSSCSGELRSSFKFCRYCGGAAKP